MDPLAISGVRPCPVRRDGLDQVGVTVLQVAQKEEKGQMIELRRLFPIIIIVRSCMPP